MRFPSFRSLSSNTDTLISLAGKYTIVTKDSVISKADVSVLTSDACVYLYKQNSENTLLSG